MIVRTEDAWACAGVSAGPFTFICEHASARIPLPLTTTISDRIWLQTHWGFDIGALGLTTELARHTHSQAILARFSRLLCDANRHRNHPDLIRETIDGVSLSFNAGLDEAEVIRRVELYHEPYHRAIDAALSAAGSQTFLISVHSFTPIWDQKLRTMDIGILFDGTEGATRDARKLQDAIEEEGFFTALNEPYSGISNLMYAADRHGRHHQVRRLELELNQAIICTPERVLRVGERIARALQKLI